MTLLIPSPFAQLQRAYGLKNVGEYMDSMRHQLEHTKFGVEDEDTTME
jgi:hypothetical protein